MYSLIYLVSQQFYEYVITFDEEVTKKPYGIIPFLISESLQKRLVWGSRQSLGKFMFFVNRYLPFVTISLFLHCKYSNSWHVTDCDNARVCLMSVDVLMNTDDSVSILHLELVPLL